MRCIQPFLENIFFADGADLYGTSSNITRKWTNTGGSLSIVSGRIAGSAIRITSPGAGSTTVSKSFTGVVTFGAAFAFKLVTADVGSTRLFLYLKNGSTQHMQIGLNTSQQLVVYNGATFTLLATGQALTVGTWYHIEIKVKIDDSTGSFEVRVNGNVTPTINLSGIDTRNGGVASIDTALFTTDSSTTQVYDIDDIVFWDTAGSSPQNNFLGEIRIETLFPTGAGTNTTWTPTGAASNFDCVDDTTPDDDTTYVSTAVSGNKDTYAMGNLTSSAVTILGTQYNLLARKTDVSAADIKSVVRTNSTNFSSSAQTPTTSYTYITDIRQVNPDTSAAWTGTEINASEWGSEFS